jgi:Tfp pilus assembly protein PilF
MNLYKAYESALQLYQTGNLIGAENIINSIIQTAPHNIDFKILLGNILQDKGQTKNAEYIYKDILEIAPDHFGVYYNLGDICLQSRRYDEAISNYRMAIRLNPDFAWAYNNMGLALKEEYEFEEAISSFRKAISCSPDFILAYINLGNILQYKNNYEESLKCYRKVLEIEPDFPDAHWNIALIQLTLGNFRDGWKEFEWRWKTGEFISQQRALPKPAWDGSDIAGKTILLTSEQGFGDVIQFVRYAPLLAGRGAKVIVECLKEMNSLLQTVEGIHQIIVKGKTLPDFDIHCPLLSLPYLFNTTPETIPANIPYLHAGNDLLQIWREKFQPNNDKHRIGIAWAGNPRHSNDRNRSCQPEIFLPLTENKAVSLFSLQKDSYTVQSDNVIKKMGMIDYTNEINDFSDTAAFIMNLDLVISVDTAVAHLAGALGKPVWLLLPFVPDWRWMLDREDSPWYPTMKLFRQPQPCDWGSIIHLITENINNILR